jgi:geranylgeranyl reductase family protein
VIWDAIVVGAGPAGAATALHLARAGHRVLLLDRARFPRDKPCSESLNPGAVAALGRLGPAVMAEILAARPARLAGFRVHAPSGVAMLGRYAAGDAPVPSGLALPRRALDAILLRAAARAGAEVREDAPVTDLVRTDGAVAGVESRTPHGVRETLPARVVVGADGLRSVVARRLGRRVATPPHRVAFTAHVTGVAGLDAVGEMHVGRDGYVGLGPIGDGVATIALVVGVRTARRRGRELIDGSSDAFVRALDAFPALRTRVPAGGLVRRVLATGPFAQWTSPPVTDGALLVGDAADFFDPFTGQGLFAALRGAELAGAALDAALRRPEPVTRGALAAYGRARWAAFAGKWALERLIAVGIAWPALAERVIGRLARRPALAAALVGACGNVLPARRVLAPPALVAMLL